MKELFLLLLVRPLGDGATSAATYPAGCSSP